MQQWEKIMEKNTISIFRNVRKDEYDRMMICFEACEKQYQAEEIICHCWNDRRKLGYVEKGEVAIVRMHKDGRQTILEYLKKGDVFGAPMSTFATETGEYYVICKKDGLIQWIDYEHLIKRCSNACSFHSQIVDNALELLVIKAVSLSEHIEVLSQRTIRDKLICYFEQQTKKNKQAEFILPFSFSVLADYLSVDRSAMMRELKKMKEEGILFSYKKRIRLCIDKNN